MPDPPAATPSPGRKFIRAGSEAELRVLMELVRRRNAGPWPPANDDLLHILDLLERNIGMTQIADAFTELLEDTNLLRATEEEGYAGSAIAISLDRDGFSHLDIAVSLKEIGGEQLAYVLEVAERHGLQVREMQGWLRLSVSDPIDPMETADEPQEALA